MNVKIIPLDYDPATGRPMWATLRRTTSEALEVVALVPIEQIAEALHLVYEARALCHREEQEFPNPELADEWERLDDARAELVYLLANMFERDPLSRAIMNDRVSEKTRADAAEWLERIMNI